MNFPAKNPAFSVQERHQDWPWQLMYEDLLWAMEKLQDPNVTEQEFYIAATILQTWIGEIENIKVFHQKSQHLQPIIE